VTKFEILLFQRKYWTVWYTYYLSALSCTWVTNFHKWSGFYRPAWNAHAV